MIRALLLTVVLLNAVLCGMAGDRDVLADELILTEAERAFIEQHPVIELGVDPKFIPFEFFDENGDYRGITADYLDLISEKTGLRFSIAAGLTWPQAYEKALSGELDALPAVSMTDERATFFLFSEPYFNFKRVIVTRDSETDVTDLADLAGQTVAVQRNSSHHSYLMAHPGINLSLYDSVEAALTAVANGSEKAFIGNLATTDYLVRSNALPHLRFIAFEGEKEQALYIAVRSDWPELVSILNKTLASLTNEEILAIQKRWIDYETDINYRPILRIVLIAGTVLAIIMAVSFYWIIRLRREISKRKQIQLDLEKAKQEADEANDFKSSFMARMSHEIRTPLNAITGMAYLLRKTGISLTQTMYVERMSQAASNMLSIINDILDYSKIEAGKTELEITSFSMDQVIQNVVNIVSYKIESQGIGFVLTKDPRIPNWFFGDSKRIEQILLNLLNNAAKFTSQGEVSLDIRLIAREKETYHLSFTIHDTGIGMSSEQVDKLFTPFTQADSSITRRFGGSGLGLSIVKNLLDLMGGKIQVFSTPGEGSTFIIQLTLPIDQVKEDEYIKMFSANHFKDIRTLVLEKSGSSMTLIESYLSAFGMACELTSSEASAVKMLEAADRKFTNRFDLLIIDYNTPADGGFNFISALHRNARIGKMPKTIMLLPMMRTDLFDRLETYGVDMGLGKPIIPSILLNGILDLFKLRAIGASHATSAVPVPAASGDRIDRVLLAEDNQTNQLIARSLLVQAGIETIIANNGQEAIDLFRLHQQALSLVLMDLHMPVMDGYESARQIRQMSSDIPIVAMTADVILGVREQCEQSGMHHYISKPFDPDHFIETVRRLIMEYAEKCPVRQDVLDPAAGLRNLGGDAALYQQVLAEYVRENRGLADRLSEAIDSGQFDEAARMVHKMKSSSGSIGAKPVYEQSVELQKLLREGNKAAIKPAQTRFSILTEQLLAEITDYQKQAERLPE